jgi:hypothetical protein
VPVTFCRSFRRTSLPGLFSNPGYLTGSVEEMARQAIALLTAGRERRISMTRAARSLWEQRFTQAAFQTQVLAAIEEWARL